MNWSILTRLLDRLQRVPEWHERDGDDQLLVRGFSALDNLICSVVGAGVILLTIISFMVKLP